MENQILSSEIEKFVKYVNTFYNEDFGIYPIASSQEIDEAVQKYVINIKDSDNVQWGFGDSLDRERVRDIIENVATLKQLHEKLDPYKNTLVIDGASNVVKLVGVREEEDDYYWVFESLHIFLFSCVGRWIPLKGFIDQEKYEELVRVWNLNHKNKAI